MPPFTVQSLVSGEDVSAIKHRLIAGAVALCLLIAAIAVYFVNASYRHGFAEKQRDLGRVAHLMGRHTAQLIEALDSELIDVSSDIEQGLIGRPELLHPVLKRHSSHIAAINEIVFVREDGLSIANSTAHPPTGINLEQRSYFRHHRENPGSGLFISEPLQRPLTESWNITLSRRFDKPDGSFGGVLLIAVSPEYFTSLYGSFNFGHEYAVTLFRKDATLLARFPSAPELLGKVFGRHPEAKAFFEGAAESLSTRFARPNVDSQPNLAEFRRVPDYPLVITASVPESVVYDSWSGQMLGIAAISLIAVVAVVLVFFMLLREIDSRTEAQAKVAAEVLRSNADLEQFAYAVSHDLKAPLRTVGGFIELLSRKHGAEMSAEGREYLMLAKGGAKRMQEMIEALLDYSRIHRQPLSLGNVDLAVCAREAADSLRAELDRTGARLEIGQLPTVRGDFAQLTRLLQNLIGNAVKYHKEGVVPQVRLSSEPVEKAWEITVSDNGIGFDSGQSGKLFKVFSRLESSERFEGTGIGLALCRSIAERHGGRIEARSEGIGKGSAFVLTLPGQG